MYKNERHWVVYQKSGHGHAFLLRRDWRLHYDSTLRGILFSPANSSSPNPSHLYLLPTPLQTCIYNFLITSLLWFLVWSQPRGLPCTLRLLSSFCHHIFVFKPSGETDCVSSPLLQPSFSKSQGLAHLDCFNSSLTGHVTPRLKTHEHLPISLRSWLNLTVSDLSWASDLKV